MSFPPQTGLGMDEPTRRLWHGIQDLSSLLDLVIQGVFNNSIKYFDILAINGIFRKNAYTGHGCAPLKIMVAHVGLLKFIGFVTQGDLKTIASI